MNEPLDIQLIIERIKAACPQLDIVDDGVALDAIKDLRSFRGRSAFVVLDDETGSSDLPTRTHQVTGKFAVVVVEVNSRSEELMASARKLIGDTRTALINWKPAGREFGQPVWKRGGVMDHDQSVLMWMDVYETKYFNSGA
jgi:hypothetical protein